MKTTCKILCLNIVLIIAGINVISAQDVSPTDPIYLSVTYMKVEPGNQTDYINMEKAWKKIHQAKIKAGAIKSWSLFRVDYPNGADTEYNFVTYANLGKNVDAAKSLDGNFFPDNWENLLTKDEMALVNRTADLRTFVKEEIWQLRDGMYDDNWQDAKIQVCNFFALADGMNGKDQYDIEKKYWMPIMEERIKNDKLEGWDISNLYLPFGANQEYEVSTTDVYKNMTQYMQAMNMEAISNKLHPNISFSEIVEKSAAVSTLIKGEVRTLLDRTN